jgi:hypothetical protein
MYFVSVYENRRMKPVEIVLIREGMKREKDGANLRYIENTSKYHNVSLCTITIC